MDQDTLEYLKHLKTLVPDAQDASDDEMYEYAVAHKLLEPPTLKEKALGALETVGKAADYVGGVTRAVGANALDAIVPGEMATMQDIEDAVKFKGAPSSSEYMKRAGVPEGYLLSDALDGIYSESGDGLKLQKGGWADPSVRGTVGMAMDIATDPLTYATFGAAGAAKLAKASGKELSKSQKVAQAIVNPTAKVGEATQKVGRGVYNVGLRNIARVGKEKGKKDITDTFWKYDIAGDADEVADQAYDVMNYLNKKQEIILDKATKEGAVADPGKAMTNAEKTARKMLKDPATKEIGEAALREIEKYKALSPHPEFKQVVPGETREIKKVIPDSKVTSHNVAGREMEGVAGVTNPATGVTDEFIPRKYTEIAETRPKQNFEIQKWPLQDFKIELVPERPATSVKQLNEYKQALNNKTGNFSKDASTALDERTARKMQEGLKDQIFLGIKNAPAGEGMDEAGRVARNQMNYDDLSETLKEHGDLLTVRKPLVQEAKKEAGQAPITQVDAITGLIKPLAFVGKQAVKYGTRSATKGGKKLYNLGVNLEELSPYVDVGGRQSYWHLMNQDEEK